MGGRESPGDGRTYWTMPKKDPAVVVAAGAALGAVVPGGLPPPLVAPVFALTTLWCWC